MATNTQTIRGTLDVTEGLNVTGDIKQNGTSVVAAIDTKQDVLVSGENLKTLSGQSLLGAGDLDVGGVEILSLVLSGAGETVITQEQADKIRAGKAVVLYNRYIYTPYSMDGGNVGLRCFDLTYTEGVANGFTRAHIGYKSCFLYSNNRVSAVRSGGITYCSLYSSYPQVINNSSQTVLYTLQQNPGAVDRYIGEGVSAGQTKTAT